jgi:hypothetical protein
MWSHRPDGTLVRDLAPVRRFMPFISPRRNESLVYYAQEVDVEAALVFLERRNASRPKDAPLTLFHLVLRAIALALHDRPRLNRFTAGGRLWQRDGVWLTFSAKKRLDDASPIVTVKKRFDAGETLGEMCDRLLGNLRESRSDKASTSDKEMGALLHLPPVGIRALMALARLADRLGLLPRAMIDADPLFTSVFVANLGSVGLEAGYHHLWEYGTCPVFCVVGRIQPGSGEKAGHQAVTLKWTFDERVEDGFYAARALEVVRERLENPEKL